MTYDFGESTAIVTGGASGIGRKTAQRFAEDGASVVVADVSVEGGQETVERIESAGGTATFVEADVSDREDVAAMIQETVDTYGSVDIAHNNAGIEGETGLLARQSEQNWEQVIDINLKGVWLSLKYELEEMVESGGGAIVNTASIAGISAAGAPPYVASKHGVVGLTRVAAMQYASEEIRVNAVCPGIIDTPMVGRASDETPQEIEQFVQMTPVGRMGSPEEVASTVTWLCSEQASYVTGTSLPIDGGYMTM